MNRWFLDENDIDIYLKCADDVRWHYNKKELVRILNDFESEIATWQTMYQSVVQTCYNDKEEIERLNKRLETQENTITNLVEDNRASQEWYKKQLADTEAQNKRVLEKLDLIVRSNQELEKENQQLKEELEKPIQDKISFAVEKIQDLKKSLRNKVCLMENDEHCYPQNAIHWQDVVALIDNQIKQLKEMK